MNPEVRDERRRRGERVDGDCRGGRSEGERERAPGGRVCVEGAGGGGAVAELERAEAHLLGGVAVAVRLALAVEHLVFGRAAPAYHSGLLVLLNNPERKSGGMKLAVVVFGEASLEPLELVAGGLLSPLHVGVALKATN